MAEGKEEAAFRIVIKNQLRGVCVTKVIGGKLTQPLPPLAVSKAVGQPFWAETCRDTKLWPNHTFAEVVKAGRIGDAKLGVFAHAGGQPGGAGFDRTGPNKIELDIVRLHLSPTAALVSVAAGGIVTKLPSETNLSPEMRPTRVCLYDKTPATAAEFSGRSQLESMVSDYVA